MTSTRLPVGGMTRSGARKTFARLLRSRVRRVAGVPGALPGDFARHIEQVVRVAGQEAEVTSTVLRPRDGWTSTGHVLSVGESVTIVTRGSVWMTKGLGLGLGAHEVLWVRIGSGPAQSLRGFGTVITAEVAGALQVLAAEPGRITDQGDLDQNVRRLPLRGSLEVIALRWEQDPVTAIAAAAEVDPDLFGSLHVRTTAASRRPTGWTYHPRIGEGGLFREASNGQIDCLTHRNVGILRHPVDIEISEDLRISWSWWVDQLPSRLPEDIEATHDYLSVAVEFDDGRDLSWIWSSTLPTGTAFPCPLAYWHTRETHLVIRSGIQDLGSWTHEHRTLTTDLAASSASRPGRVVAVWLIANSVFQGGTGTFHVRDIRLQSNSQDQDIVLAATSSEYANQ